ncbi:MAG TPA: ester cyclase [Roseiflexaceae bacterium]|nr:ester cyclase [Roseiflexaceae bacterium]
MSAEQNKAIVRRMVEEAQSRQNLAAVDELFAADFVDHSVPPGLPPNREGVKMQFAMFFAAFPDLRVVIHAQVAEGDEVVTRKTFHGTHQGDLMGMPPNGRPIAFDVIDILRLKDGKITDHWNVVDQLGLMRQIGAISAPEQIDAARA